MRATTAMILDTRSKKQDNTYPVKLRVTYDRKQKYYKTDLSFTEEKYQRIVLGSTNDKKGQTIKIKNTAEEKQTQIAIQYFETKAIEIICGLSNFTWEKFETKYFTNQTAKDTLNAAFDSYSSVLRLEGRIGTAVTYECSKTSLNAFYPDCKFLDVTPTFLKKYEKWMVAKGCSITTVGIYLRSLRTLFNNAISDEILSKDIYPFGKKKYEIPTSNNVKKALTISDIGAIYFYPVDAGSTAEMAKDYWYFMYLCNGMNMKDMCLLKFGNIKGGVLEFVRAKTVRTKRKVEAIRITLAEDALSIIQKWGNTRVDDNTYIFPVLTTGLTPERQRELIQQRTHLINDHMKEIAGKLGIAENVTTYFARHSFATILQRSGASVSFISEALGHGNVQTTQNYLGGFEDDKKEETMKALTAFKAK